jgi:hypothetical protein
LLFFQAHESAPTQSPAKARHIVEAKGEDEGYDNHSEYADGPAPSSMKPPPTPDRGEKKKKKGIFGGLFGGKKGKKSKDVVGHSVDRPGSRPRVLRSPMSRKLKNMSSTEGSI